jgi:hypothetical protein
VSDGALHPNREKPPRKKPKKKAPLAFPQPPSATGVYCVPFNVVPLRMGLSHPKLS